ncbi:MAG: NAD(P)-dependent oxidoreductase [Pseudomonadota bacterium]
MKFFPMFLNMQGRRVIVLGGGEQAAQKVRLLLKTDAEILVVSDALDDELGGYLSEGKILFSNAEVTPDLLVSAVLVFSATGCAGAGAAHAGLAAAANVLVNVVDQPENCDAITPSIVDRDPLVVAIGTEGAAPVLARQIKASLETQLEPDLGQFVRFAGSMRRAVRLAIPKSTHRSFWSWVFSARPRQLFQKGATGHAFQAVKAAVKDHGGALATGGSFHEVRVSEDDPDQVRLGDLRALQEADIIVATQKNFDKVLELARRDAERVYDRSYADAGEADLRGKLARDPSARIVKLVTAH